jgi:hypothetical protein
MLRRLLRRSVCNRPSAGPDVGGGDDRLFASLYTIDEGDDPWSEGEVQQALTQIPDRLVSPSVSRTMLRHTVLSTNP